MFMNLSASPEEFENLKHETELPKVAVGIPSIVSSVRHVFGQMPVIRGLKVLSKLNQKRGIDCPSCAWADPDGHRSPLAEYCENGAKAIADEATIYKAGKDLFEKYTVQQLSGMSDFELGQQGRLLEPLIIREGKEHYEPITWDEVFALLAEKLKALASPHEAVFYTSGRSSNEAAFLYQLFVREFGTNNLPDCSNMCHESSGVALTETLGLGKGSVTLEDFEHTELIVIMGQNPGTNHPRMLSSLEAAKEKGATIVSINPLVEPGLVAFKNPQKIGGILGSGTQLSDYYWQIRINGDLALLKALLILLLKAEEKNPGTVLDQPFIRSQTEGFEAMKKELQHYSLDALSVECGIPLSEIEKLAFLFGTKKKIIVCWAMGITQHQNAVYTIREIVNLLLLKGSIGKPGAGVCPVRGHSNVQGDRTMGIFHLPLPKLVTRLRETFGFEPPLEKGYDVVESIQAMYEKKVKVFFALGGNLLAAAPDTIYTAEAFRNCELTVHVSTKLNRSHLVHGKTGLILPCLGRTDRDIQSGGEQFLSTENSMGVVQKTQGILKPLSSLMKSEPWIVAKLAHEVLGHKSKTDWLKLSENYDSIRELIARTIDGFEDMNSRVRQAGGFYLPNGPRVGIFTTISGKALLTVNPWKAIAVKENELIMMSIRSHDQFNTTIYGLNDRYRGIYNERRVVFMNREDIQQRGWKQYDIVNLYSYYNGVERTAKKFIIIEYSIPKGCAATYYPESNSLVPIDSFADKSQTPTSKSVVITMKKVGRYNMEKHQAEL